jgi:tRNA (mo5U34)-methyltransferase
MQSVPVMTVDESTRADLRARIDKLPWHHSIDLGSGIVTPGGKSLEICNAEAALIFDRVNLQNLSVLDIGAWNGVFSFEAKHRGASRVLATDSYTWEHPYFKGRDSFELARSVLGLDVDARQIDVSDLSIETVGKFDVVLYLGVFYHRYDAIESLKKVAALATKLLIVETHLDLRDLSVPAMAFYPGHELNNDATNWWGPNEHCVLDLLRGHGFSDIEMTAHPAGHSRAIFHAWRTTDARIRLVGDNNRLKPLAETQRLELIKRRPLTGRVVSRLGPRLGALASRLMRL